MKGGTHGHTTPIPTGEVVKVAVTSPLLSLWPLLCHTLTGEGGNDLSSTLTEDSETMAMVTLQSFLGRV